MNRIGLGEDLHLLVAGRKLILGGIEIPFEFGLLGHSDADVILHALSDALLGAIADKDIGAYFPPNDPSIEGIDSKKILAFCVEKVRQKGFSISNVDIVVTLEKPKLRPYVDDIRASIAGLLDIDIDLVGLQAKTNEGCDAVGRREAISCRAICLLTKEGN